MAECKVLVFGAPNAGKTYFLNGLVVSRKFQFESQIEQRHEAKGHTFVEVPEYVAEAVSQRLQREASAKAQTQLRAVFVVKLDSGRLRAVDAYVLKKVTASPDVKELCVVMPMGPKVHAAFQADTYRSYCAAEEHRHKVHMFPLLHQQGFDSDSAAVPALPREWVADLWKHLLPAGQLKPAPTQEEMIASPPTFAGGMATIAQGLGTVKDAMLEHVNDAAQGYVLRPASDKYNEVAQQVKDSSIGQTWSKAVQSAQGLDSQYQITEKVGEGARRTKELAGEAVDLVKRADNQYGVTEKVKAATTAALSGVGEGCDEGKDRLTKKCRDVQKGSQETIPIGSVGVTQQS